MKSGFTSLSNDLGSCIISEWIELKDLIRLDYACNNHSIRSAYLSYCQGGTIKTELIQLRSINQIQWFINRELKFLIMSTSLLQFQRGIYNYLNELLVKIGGDIEEIHICPHSSLTPAQIVRFNNIIAQNCLNLQELNVSGNIKDKDISALLTLQHLEDLNFTYCNISSKSFYIIANICDQLISLSLQNISVCDAGLTALAGKCPDLKELFIVNCQNVTAKGVLAIVQTTPYLTSLSVLINDFTDATMTTIAQHCPRLQTIEITTSLVTEAGIQTLFKHCFELRTIFFGNFISISIGFTLIRNLHELSIYDCPTLTDTMVATIVQNNPFLKRLKLSRCTQLTSAAVLTILRGCPELCQFAVTNTTLAATSKMTSLMSTLIQEHYPKITEADINIV